jgi:hypothetical protein
MGGGAQTRDGLAAIAALADGTFDLDGAGQGADQLIKDVATGLTAIFINGHDTTSH